MKIDRDKAIQDNWDAIQTMRRPANMPRISPERLEEIRELHGSFSSIQDLFAHIDVLEAENDDLRNTRAVLNLIRAEEERDRLKERVAKLREAILKFPYWSLESDHSSHIDAILAADDEMEKS